MSSWGALLLSFLLGAGAMTFLFATSMQDVGVKNIRSALEQAAPCTTQQRRILVDGYYWSCSGDKWIRVKAEDT